MSFQAMNHVVSVFETAAADVLTAADRLLLLLLANRHNPDDGYARPSRARLERETGLSETSVKRSIRQLEENGFIRRVMRHNQDGGPAPNAYQFIGLDVPITLNQGGAAGGPREGSQAAPGRGQLGLVPPPPVHPRPGEGPRVAPGEGPRVAPGEGPRVAPEPYVKPLTLTRMRRLSDRDPQADQAGTQEKNDEDAGAAPLAASEWPGYLGTGTMGDPFRRDPDWRGDYDTVRAPWNAPPETEARRAEREWREAQRRREAESGAERIHRIYRQPV